VAKLAEKVKRGDQPNEDALDELRRASRDAKDPDVRKAAEEALEQAKQPNGPGKAKEAKPGPGPNASSKESGDPQKGQPPGAGEARDAPADGPEVGKGKGPGDGEGPEQAAKGERKSGGKYGGSGPGGKGLVDDPKARDPNADFAKRGGDLTLEDWQKVKDKVTPEVLKKAGVSPQEWQQWLKDYQAYQEKLRRLATQTPDPRATRSQLSSRNLSQVKPGTPGGPDPLQAERGQAPPELRPGYNRFTDPTAGKKGPQPR
jgi:hypothetical protein